MRPYFAPILFVMLTSIACNTDTGSIRGPELLIDHESIEFSIPQDESYAESVLQITNAGDEDLLIHSLELVEDDETSELSIINIDDWSEPVLISSGITKSIQVGWHILDTSSDTGSITIDSNAGRRVIPIRTDAHQSMIMVEVTPQNESDPASLDITLNQVMEINFQRANIQVRSTGNAPLIVTDVCWLNDRECQGEQQRGYSVCRNQNATPSNCEPVVPFPILAPKDETSITVLFDPQRADNQFVGRLKLSSDASNTPELTINFTSELCIRSPSQMTCGLCGNGEVDLDMGEECDDGNLDDMDQCTNHCTFTCQGTNSCPTADVDEDGINDGTDNCLNIQNFDQSDCDGDGVGDVCDEDPCPSIDDDGDGIINDVDNCPEVENPNQEDCDQDGLGNVCDLDECDNEPNQVEIMDVDQDGIADSVDNCPDLHNPQQSDIDRDGAGDLCDPQPDEANHVLIHQSIVQATGIARGEQFLIQGALSSGTHQSFGNQFIIQGALTP